MTIPLPPAIQRYLHADAGRDSDNLATCFAPDAEVRDEGRTIKGTARHPGVET